MQVRVQRSTTHSWYRDIQERFEEFNTFLFPLPRDQGYEFFVVQFLGKEVHFTSLINYQAHKENAPECLNMIHYTELAQTKGIVLMVGEYDKDNLVRNASLIVFCHYLGSCNICNILRTLAFKSTGPRFKEIFKLQLSKDWNHLSWNLNFSEHISSLEFSDPNNPILWNF